MWEHQLLNMYQQWQQGNQDYMFRYMDFAELVARHNNMTVDAVMRELQKYHWFQQPDSN
jgi:ClpP class serine protease